MTVELHLGDCLEVMRSIPDKSVDAVITDPPYLYLNHKLDRPFDEDVYFPEVKRILKPSGFYVSFGRGESFYRWNTRLADLGFEFKEEFIWNKVYGTSPLMKITRIHETISIFGGSCTTINKVKVPYLEMKEDNIVSINRDIDRLCSVFSDSKNLKAVQDYLLTGERNDFEKTKLASKHEVNRKALTAGEGNRAVNVMNSIEKGMNEKSIIKVAREHYKMEHPTQKPVRLIERLMALVSSPGVVIFDPFMGSGTTGVACVQMGRNFIGIEIDPTYFAIAERRIKEAQLQLRLPLEVQE